ncbi:SAPAP family [Trinorchestia longiramus]|nr:SAPAP family [Trinorchestia longiramus]
MTSKNHWSMEVGNAALDSVTNAADCTVDVAIGGLALDPAVAPASHEDVNQLKEASEVLGVCSYGVCGQEVATCSSLRGLLTKAFLPPGKPRRRACVACCYLPSYGIVGCSSPCGHHATELGPALRDWELVSVAVLCAPVENTLKLSSVAGSFESCGSAQPGSEHSRSPVSRSSLGRAPPSYLGIACAVSGYSSINRYDSSVREGFRSRDCSPAPGRLAFARSRDSSPLRERLKSPENKSTPQETAVRISELKAQLARCARELGGQLEERSRQNSIRRRDKKPPSGRSVSVDRGYLTKASEIHTGASQGYSKHGQRTSTLSPDYSTNYSRTNTSAQRQNYFSGGSMTSHQIPVRLIDTQQSFNGHISSPLSLHSDALDSHIENTKSFIRERIERLYGPGALAAGFTRRSPHATSSMGNSVKRTSAQSRPEGRIIPIQLEYNDEVDKQSNDESGRSMPSVFRHLRPEFRYQLPVKSPVSSPSSSASNKKSEAVAITNGYHHTKEIPVEVLPTNGVSRTCSVQPKETTTVVTKTRSTCQVSPNNKKEDNNSNKIIDVAIAPSSEISVEDNKSLSVEPKLSKETAENTVPLPHNGCGVSSLRNKVSPALETDADVSSSATNAGVKDGHYFLKIVAAEVESLEKEVSLLEKDLEEQGSSMTEDVRGKLLATTGKTKLLISQKIKQFKGLCQKNIAGQQEGDEFPTTCEDLAGFWDMVSLQVEDVRDMLRAAAGLKANAWKEPAGDTVDAGNSCQASKSSRASAGRTARRVKPALSATASEAAKAKDEARKKAAEERRKAMREAMKAKRAAAAAESKEGKQDDSVEIFVPEA